MFRRLGTSLACLAMFSIVGGHWTALQMIAWGGMLRNYARTDGLAVAAKKTFSGDYPCEMCRKISEGKKKEEQAPIAKVEKKSENFLTPRCAVALFPPPPAYLLSIPETLPPDDIVHSPPRPVPIAA